MLLSSLAGSRRAPEGGIKVLSRRVPRAGGWAVHYSLPATHREGDSPAGFV